MENMTEAMEKEKRDDGKLAEDDSDYYDVYRSCGGCYFGKNVVCAGTFGGHSELVYCLCRHAADRKAWFSYFLFFADRGLLLYAECEKICVEAVFVCAHIGDTF